MHQFLDHLRIAAVGFSASVMISAQAQAFVILPSFDTSITSNGNAAALQAAINTAANTIDALYSNPGTIRVLFEFNSAVLGQTQTGQSFLTYSGYTNLLSANAVAHPSNTVLATAFSHLAQGNVGGHVLGTTAYWRVALGLAG